MFKKKIANKTLKLNITQHLIKGTQFFNKEYENKNIAIFTYKKCVKGLLLIKMLTSWFIKNKCFDFTAFFSTFKVATF